jgi:hypothetical protein
MSSEMAHFALMKCNKIKHACLKIQQTGGSDPAAAPLHYVGGYNHFLRVWLSGYILQQK